MDRVLAKNLIKDFNFKKLFNELGWDNHQHQLPIELNNKIYYLEGIAKKRDFIIYLCLPDDNGNFPDYPTRKNIEKKVTSFAFEHIIVFYDSKNTTQIWQWVRREQGKPTATREHRYYSHQDPESLVQKIINLKVSLDEEDSIAITDIRGRASRAFDIETVTKRFYDRFKREHDLFQNFIKGITDKVDKDWYTSLMLNRLMFIYFIQKKNFLNNDINYLKNKLQEVKSKFGNDKFHSFYRTFLLKLFHQGLGSRERTPELVSLLGKIPYLNGGLFDVHQLELKYNDIDIPDDAFEKIFDFFDQYEWHLDTRKQARGNEVNPDVIGYIFEKYINDRAAMGAYYTKEDITEYISKNCIIPFLFDETIRKMNNENAFSDSFEMLRNNPNKYIYDAVKKGIPEEILNKTTEISDEEIFLDLPDEIKAGYRPDLHNKIVDGNGEYLCDIRKSWNKPAPPEIALPTEIYREVIERRNRYKEIRNKILAGEINSINDFITYNLNIRQFIQDVIENTNNPFLIKNLYSAIKSISILDPTCGSGAFLFAALNILEPLYEACIQRMQNFVDDAKFLAEHKSKEKTIEFKEFEDEINYIKSPQHPNEKYFIYKSIILNNLFGVDIMKEAVEIAKLRLFLKLVGTVEVDQRKENLGLEPLPDIDFNIKAGNTLVGYVSLDELQNSMQTGRLDFDEEFKKKLLSLCGEMAIEMKHFKDYQEKNEDESKMKKIKEKINLLLEKLGKDSDLALAKYVYNIDTDDKKRFEQWKSSHQPFHWYYEFFEIISQRGGFDVIIGNPPYVEYSKVRSQYTIKGFETENCGNLYAYVLERSIKLSNQFGKTSFIVQAPILCTERMYYIQEIINKIQHFISSFDDRPLKLFEGIQHSRMAILILNKNINYESYITRYIKIKNKENLFQNDIVYQLYQDINKPFFYNYPKINNTLSKKILNKLNYPKKLSDYQGNTVVYFYNAPGNFIRCQLFDSDSLLGLSINNEIKYFTHCLLNSSLFYFWCSVYFFGRTGISLKENEIKFFPLSSSFNSLQYSLYSRKIDKNYRELLKIDYEYQPLKKFLKITKHIIDEIDKVLAEHYGFTQEELDFIINYDIKYRMGQELGEDV